VHGRRERSRDPSTGEVFPGSSRFFIGFFFPVLCLFFFQFLRGDFDSPVGGGGRRGGGTGAGGATKGTPFKGDPGGPDKKNPRGGFVRQKNWGGDGTGGILRATQQAGGRGTQRRVGVRRGLKVFFLFPKNTGLPRRFLPGKGLRFSCFFSGGGGRRDRGRKGGGGGGGVGGGGPGDGVTFPPPGGGPGPGPSKAVHKNRRVPETSCRGTGSPGSARGTPGGTNRGPRYFLGKTGGDPLRGGGGGERGEDRGATEGGNRRKQGFPRGGESKRGNKTLPGGGAADLGAGPPQGFSRPGGNRGGLDFKKTKKTPFKHHRGPILWGNRFFYFGATFLFLGPRGGFPGGKTWGRRSKNGPEGTRGGRGRAFFTAGAACGPFIGR